MPSGMDISAGFSNSMTNFQRMYIHNGDIKEIYGNRKAKMVETMLKS